MTTYHVELDSGDNGLFEKDLSSDLLEAEWHLGMDAPFDSVAAVATAEITLRNSDSRYSPEAANSPIERGLTLRIRSDDGATVRPHFVGTVTEVVPSPGANGPRTVRVLATSPLRSLTENRVRLQPLVDVDASTVVSAVLGQIPFRLRYLDGAFIVGTTGYAEVGVNSRLPGDAALIGSTLQTGVSRFAYVGDNWDDGITAVDAVREVVEAERGRFFVDRNGDFVLFNRHETLLRTSSVATFADDMSGLDLTHGGDTVSRVAVTLRPRRLGSDNDTLWTLGQPQLVPAGGVRTFIARFRGSSSEGIGALSVHVPRRSIDYRANTRRDGSGIELTDSFEVRRLEADAAAARVQVINYSDRDGFLLAGAALRGQAIYTADPMTVEVNDGASVTTYGGREFRLDLPGLTSLNDADDIARYELARRTTPRTRVRELRLESVSHRPQILARTLFDRITVSDEQSAHTADYFIVAEAHHIHNGGASHHVRWTLEPANPGAFWLLGEGTLDAETHLSY